MKRKLLKVLPVQNDAAEDVITQNNEDAIAIKKKEEANKKKEADQIAEQKKKIEKERVAEIERKKLEEKKKAEKERKAKAAKRKGVDDITDVFSDNNGNVDGGEGDDNKAGDEGKETGDPKVSGHYGNGGGGGGGNYSLENRKALSKPKPTYDCNEEGRVFVRISVDKNGNVFAAQAGVKGTTNSAFLLVKQSKRSGIKNKI